ncbi:TlpA family protein disulfide reductase [Proteiniclasticum sp. SCR006]|uniref:TlpA family protein disulfide reductase n=1 Tax=Proteiniclasticum aestuarii TaxID=2817862 RepID=A0A939HF17_9CLOT|nr:TlpA disulfide reductase family protein [Proteiniclasticum aestuarii]MBO1266123.1 TlpA family protein disulfide reductase [Proteiniclasticum aestuarii]
MKKYSFIVWILIFVLVIGGGYYFIEKFGGEELSDSVVQEPQEETSEDQTPSEEPVADDAISELKVKTPFTPDFIVLDGNGEEVSISEYRGKKVIVNFWASWCPPCIREMPEFQSLHNELDEEETILLAINLTDGQRETKTLADNFLAENNLNLNVLYDTVGNAFYEFGVTSIPQTFFLDEEGTVQYSILGMTDKVTLDAVLERME